MNMSSCSLGIKNSGMKKLIGLMTLSSVSSLKVKFITYNMGNEYTTGVNTLPKELVGETDVDVYVVSTQEQNFFFTSFSAGATYFGTSGYYRGGSVCFPEGEFEDVKMVESISSGFNADWCTKRQFRLFIYRRRSSEYTVEVKDEDTRHVRSKIEFGGLVSTKGGVLAKVNIYKDRVLVTSFVASSIHIPNAGATEKHGDTASARKASTEGLKIQSDSYDEILTSALTLADGDPIFLNGDHNERTVSISKDDVRPMSDQDFHDRLNDCEFILRQKAADSWQDIVKNPLFGKGGLRTIASRLNRGEAGLSSDMLNAGSLRYRQHTYHKHRFRDEYLLHVKEAAITFDPTYKKHWVGSIREYKCGSCVPAFADRLLVVGTPQSVEGWVLDNYTTIKLGVQNQSDHDAVCMTATWSPKRRPPARPHRLQRLMKS